MKLNGQNTKPAKSLEIYANFKIMKFISIKKLPYDMFKAMLEDEGISNTTKTFLKKERGDKRYKEN